ncbi:heart- and neural crest derivatives-expressed protein 1 [Penaeus vannamei]|uniref:heart- and neural crest derivatives-expressed protein 1 n=1 Tax=Penaeus vannamei TaxID=6689 RepID=UPI00387F4FC9
MSSGCEGGWPGYPYCAYPPPPPPQWSAHPHHHYHHHHHHTPDFCSPQPPAPPPPLVTYGDGSAIPPCPQHYWDGDDLVDECGRVIRRKTSANKKERRRTQSINNAFAELRECIPNVPADTKLSKIKTLRLATSYIAYLMEVLHTEDSTAAPPPEPFRANLPPRTRPSQAISGDHDKDESDMETEPTTPTGAAQGSVASATSPSGAASVSPSSSTTSPPEGGALERRKGRTGWPETVWAQELKH